MIRKCVACARRFKSVRRVRIQCVSARTQRLLLPVRVSLSLAAAASLSSQSVLLLFLSFDFDCVFHVSVVFDPNDSGTPTQQQLLSDVLSVSFVFQSSENAIKQVRILLVVRVADVPATNALSFFVTISARAHVDLSTTREGLLRANDDRDVYRRASLHG